MLKLDLIVCVDCHRDIGPLADEHLCGRPGCGNSGPRCRRCAQRHEYKHLQDGFITAVRVKTGRVIER